MRSLVVALSFFALIVPQISYGQVAVAGKVVRELVEQIGIRGGKSASEELVRLGGEKTVQEVLEKAAKEGGEALVEKTARYSVEYGPIVLRGAKESPLKFISAFEKLPPIYEQVPFRRCAGKPSSWLDWPEIMARRLLK